MRYFLIEEEKTFAQRPCVINWYEKIDVRKINKKDAYRLPDRELLFIRSNPETVFTDIISTPFFIVSEKIEKVLRMYEPGITTKEIVLKRSCLGDCSIFRIADIKKQYIVGNLDIIESILKRGAMGIGIKEIELTD